MRYLSIITLLISTLAFLSCSQKQSSSPAPDPVSDTAAASSIQDENIEQPSFAQLVEQAHAKADFRKHAAVQFDLQLFFGGTERLNGTLTLSTDSRQALIATRDGKKIYVQDDKIFFPPATENVAGTRFSAYTWPYFFLLPFKLSDGGTIWTDYPNKTLNGNTYLTHKLSFKAGTGDAPDDWYILYANEADQLLQVAAYIVTAGQNQEEAEKDPHAIEYLNYQTVDGVPFATEWRFRSWRTNEGLSDQLGKATLSNIKFVEDTQSLFTPPTNFVEG